MFRRSAARACRARLLQSSGFATVSESLLKVSVVDGGRPAASVSLVLKAGPRFEAKPGLAHVLKNFAFKGTSQRSALKTVVLSVTLGREYLAFTAQFLRGDEKYFVDVLSGLVTSSNFANHELHESVAPQIEAEARAASADPAVVAIDVAHTLAFRSGLGNPLLAPSHNTITVEDVKAFAAQTFTKDNVAIIGSNVQVADLTQLVQKSLEGLTSGTTATIPTKYYGGESRISAHTLPTIFIGFGTSTPSPPLAVLSSYLDPTPSMKWSEGLSPLSVLPVEASVQVVHESYSDGALLGILIQGPTTEVVKEAGKIAVKALKDAGAGAINSDALTRALSKARFSAASALEGHEGLTASVAAQV
ncbi:hypothetical protein BS47DRAFT_1344183 [Hydnum rufescens UP504]|uniref:Cytochrome b-c1 complex subunit 2, mitochondrial n=1 Tax=Hydnum rufescens UP504 TaxID=1448309 RepID=A0A9P6AXJ6_9AGAM|nr:hypothetical protein BS47DRAFT_1344183 [Hydnum rufescens UP504]